MNSQKLAIIVALIILISIGSAKADTGAGVKVSFVDTEIIGTAQAEINFEAVNINPTGSADITAIEITVPTDFTTSGGLSFPNLLIKPGETKKLAITLRAPNPNSDKEFTIKFKIFFSDDSVSIRTDKLKVLADRIAPLIDIANANNSTYLNAKPADFKFKVLDPFPSSGINQVEARANAGNFENLSKPGEFYIYSFNPEADGIYEISYRVFDNAGNAQEQKKITVFFDTTAPNVTIENLSEITNNPTPQVFFRFTDQFATYSNCEVSVSDYKENVLSNADVLNSVTLPKLADGNYTAEIDCADFAGNIGKSSQAQFAVDTKPPSIINISPSNGTFLAGNQTIIIQFDKEMKVEDLRELLVMLEGDKTLNLNISTWDNKTFTVEPPEIEAGKKYQLVVNDNLTDTAGNKINSSGKYDFESVSTGFAILTGNLSILTAVLGTVMVISVFYVFYRRKKKQPSFQPKASPLV